MPHLIRLQGAPDDWAAGAHPGHLALPSVAVITFGSLGQPHNLHANLPCLANCSAVDPCMAAGVDSLPTDSFLTAVLQLYAYVIVAGHCSQHLAWIAKDGLHPLQELRMETCRISLQASAFDLGPWAAGPPQSCVEQFSCSPSCC